MAAIGAGPEEEARAQARRRARLRFRRAEKRRRAAGAPTASGIPEEESTMATAAGESETSTEEASAAPPPNAAPAGGHDAPLGFTEDEAEQLQVRWCRLQGRFVDDPQASVREAGALLGEVIRTLAERADAQRDRAATEDTEELRRLLLRYRGFVDHLLSPPN